MYYTVSSYHRANNFPDIVPVTTGIVVGNAGVVYTTVTGAGVVTPRQI